jgi:hypothetical protein
VILEVNSQRPSYRGDQIERIIHRDALALLGLDDFRAKLKHRRSA